MRSCSSKSHANRIEGHECGRYKEELEQTVKNAENSLQRYMFYYERFSAHDATRQMGQKLAQQLEDHKAGIIERGIETNHFTQILENAHRVAIRARRLLAWSYVFSFYLFSGENQSVSNTMRVAHKNLFEDFQMQLEGSLEILTKLTQTLPVDDTIWGVMERSANMTKIVAKKLRGLLDVIQNHILEEGAYGVQAAEAGIRR
eukprot:TRINITY_DN1081_c0_g1_i4.p1 TRINITY_DN1081_c0_g1~~TRINITY_DN1081_c0_g1_i4.p1  ORF type:complete len:202 (+),score=48.66 TRINITY_DN1081_c0_g1_i4:219-824(+)